MEALNLSLFALINAPEHPAPFMLTMSHALAVYALWLLPLMLVAAWLSAYRRYHLAALYVVLGVIVALALNTLISLLWHHPRPFAMPVGHTFLYHEADSSFPSDHMTIIMTTAFVLLSRQATRPWGIGTAIVGLMIGWSRIYLGVHFPIDMAGALVVALCSTLIVNRFSPLFMATLYRMMRRLYRSLFGPLIRRGWLHQ